MSATQMNLPAIPKSGSWIGHIVPFLGVSWERSRGKVLSKRFRPYCNFGNTPYGVPITVKRAWILTIQTPWGKADVEVKESFYDLVEAGDVLPMKCRRSRAYGREFAEQVQAKLIKF